MTLGEAMRPVTDLNESENDDTVRVGRKVKVGDTEKKKK